jgi:hypothetical protein
MGDTAVTSNSLDAGQRDFLASVITTAVEGGIGYWSFAEDYRWFFPGIPSSDLAGYRGGTAEPGPDGTANAYMTLHPNDDDESDFKPKTIEVEDIMRALNTLMVNESLVNTQLRRTILRAWFTEDAGDIDADCADVLVQIAMFGKVVYG